VGTEPTSGNEPITESTDTEAIEAQEAADAEAEEIAEQHKYTGPQLTAEEYDAQGKGKDYDADAEPVYGNPLGQAQPGATGNEQSAESKDKAEAKQTAKRLEQGKQSTAKG
jgi:hypothetical protein